jgi:hypothetical protein
MFDSFKLTESRTDNPDVPEFVDDVVGPPGSPAGSFDLVFPTQTAFPEISGLKIEHDVIEFSPDQARTWMATAMAESGGQTGVSRGNAVATESLEIAHEGFLGDLLDCSTANAEDSFVWKTGDGHDSTSHSGGIQVMLNDGSVRLADVSDSLVNFDDNSQPIGQTVTFTYTVTNSGNAPMTADGGYLTNQGDHPETELTTEPTAPEPNLDSSAVATLINFDFDGSVFQPQLTTEPTAPEALRYQLDRCVVKLWSTSGDADDANFELTSGQATGEPMESADMSPWTVMHATNSHDADDSVFQPQLPSEPSAPNAEDIEVVSYLHSNSSTDASPDIFDCSELVQWASPQASPLGEDSKGLFQINVEPTSEPDVQPSAESLYDLVM